jgi:hypothetical protein
VMIHMIHMIHLPHLPHLIQCISVPCVYHFTGAKTLCYSLPYSSAGMLSKAQYGAAKQNEAGHHRDTGKTALKSARFLDGFRRDCDRAKVTIMRFRVSIICYYRNLGKKPIRTMAQDVFWGAIWAKMLKVKSNLKLIIKYLYNVGVKFAMKNKFMAAIFIRVLLLETIVRGRREVTND